MSKRACILLCLALLLPLALGQTVEFAVAHPPDELGNRRLEVVFADVPEPKGSVGLRVAAGDELELGLRFRRSASVATIGNIITTLATDASSGGRYAVALSSRGVLGPAALRLRASLSDGGEPLAPIAEGSLPPLPVLGFGPPLVGLEGGASYRPSRGLIVDVAPGLFLREASVAGRLAGEVRLVRAAGDDDISFLLHAFMEPGLKRGSAALGLGYKLNRRRAPAWLVSAWLGLGPAGVSPGVRLAGSERLEEGQLDLAAALEPYRVDAWPYRLELGYQHQLGPGSLRFAAQAGLVPGSGWRGGLRAGYRIRFSP